MREDIALTYKEIAFAFKEMAKLREMRKNHGMFKSTNVVGGDEKGKVFGKVAKVFQWEKLSESKDRK